MKRKQLQFIRITALVLVAVMLIVTAAFCLGNLVTHDAEVHRQEAIFDELAEAAEETPIVESAPDGSEATLFKFETLLGKNSDMVGWISVKGTNINYPVMQTKNKPNYYLKRNFNKEYSDLGVPYPKKAGWCSVHSHRDSKPSCSLYGKTTRPSHRLPKDFSGRYRLLLLKCEQDLILLY